MSAKQLLFRNDARAKLVHGATALADAVRITLAMATGQGVEP